MLFISITELSCVGNEQPGNSPVRAAIQTKQWYRQALVDLGAKIRMYSENDGVAISRGMGKDVRGKAYRFTNGQWVPFVEFPYSDYPLIGRFDSTNVWTITHLTHEYAYRPVHTIFTNSIRKEIPLPKIMWDEVDYVMFKGLHQLSDGTAWMVGQQGHILYYNGVRWEEKKSPLINPDRSSSYDGDLNDITMTTHQSGWAVGRNGVILRYENSQWNIVPSPVNQTLQKISMVNDSTGWAVGNSGTILQCRKFVWTKVFIDMHEQLFSIVAFDERNAWIVGNNSTLLSYDGTSWSTDESIKNYNDLFADLSVVRDSSGQLQFWIIGNEGIYTTHQSLGVSFTDVTDHVGLRRVGKLGHFLERSDADLPDLLVANDGGSSLLYENTGEGLYADVTGTTELLTSPKAALIMAVGDVNNDGEQDVLEVADQRNFGLYLGTSAGGFRDFTDRSALSFDEINPMAPAAAKFVELNNDGNLDLYISNYDMPDQIFLGDGTGRFFRFREKSGIEKILNHASYGAAFGDFNNDGLTDIFIPYYVSNNKKFFSMFQNTGGMKFEEVDDPNFYSSTDLSPTAIAVSDVNNDGFADVYIHSQKVAPLLWLNDGTGKFTDVSRQYGFTQFAGQLEPINGIVGSADVNNDGQIDIFAGSHLYLNSQRGQFSEVSERVGIQFVGTPIFSDVDNDGDQDMFIGSSRTSLGKGDRAALYRNNLNNNNFVKVRVRGDVSNRS
ncbi:MAG: FG-GAP-like repeat-containing protein, partial [Bacteriovoracaceae bacterium]